MAIQALCLCPPDSCPILLFLSSLMSVTSRAQSTISLSLSLSCALAKCLKKGILPYAIRECTGRSGGAVLYWCTIATFWANSLSLISFISLWSKNTLPSLGFKFLVSSWNSVDFPQPLAPIRVVILLSLISNEIPFIMSSLS